MIKLELIKNLRSNCKKEDFEKIIKTFYVSDRVLCEKILKRKPGLLTLVLTDDAELQKYNKKIRGKDKPTDVLSFVYLEKAFDSKNKFKNTILGDILISLDKAKEQAKEKKHSLKEEVSILFTHGLLHVFGYDHNNDSEEEEMEKMSEIVLEKFLRKKTTK
jgi:probable rRNA maturation factor